jgi:thioredoxin
VPALDDAGFEAHLSGAVPVLVDFWAPWCVPCRKISPVVEALAREMEGSLNVAALDVDANPVAASRHAVLSLPTLILFRDGRELARLTGTPSERKIRRMLSQHLP